MKVKVFNNKLASWEWQGTKAFCQPNINTNQLQEIEIPDPPEDFLEKSIYYDYDIQNNKYIFDQEKFEEDNKNLLIEKIRQRRETECFSLIDKSQLWYDNLTNKQKEQLNIWYKDWLKAPQTMIIPSKPSWL